MAPVAKDDSRYILHPNRAAVTGDEPILDTGGPARLRHRPKLVGHSVAILRMHELHEQLAVYEELLGAIAKHPPHTLGHESTWRARLGRTRVSNRRHVGYQTLVRRLPLGTAGNSTRQRLDITHHQHRFNPAFTRSSSRHQRQGRLESAPVRASLHDSHGRGPL